jgi:Fe-S-cluster containining protein
LELYNTIQAREGDVWRWMAEERQDILKWVGFIFADKAQTEIVAYDFPIDPQTDEEPDRCPFLRKLPRQDRYICRIQDTKPENCVRFPLDREADGIGCPGYQES